MVLGEPLELVVAEAIRAAVPDVAERDLVVAHHRRRERGAHPRVRLVRLRELVDLAVGRARDLGEQVLGASVRDVLVRELIYGDLRCHLARASPAHPVRHGEHRRGLVVAVLVCVPLAAYIGEPCLFRDPEHRHYSW